MAQLRLEQAMALAWAARTSASSDCGDISRSVRSMYQIEADSLRTLGMLFSVQGSFARAKTTLEQALRIDREIGDRRGEGVTLGRLGHVSGDLCDYEKAIGYYEQALCISCDTGDRWGESIALGRLGHIHARVGDYAQARDYYQQGLDICCKIGDRRGEGWTLGHLSLLLYQQSDNEDALAYSQQALSILQDLDDSRVQAQVLTCLGHALVGLGYLVKAANVYQQALELRRKLGEPHLATEVLAGLACISMARGDLFQAQAQVDEVLAHLEANTLDHTIEPCRVYLICARVLRANNKPRAQDIVNTAYRLLQERAARISDEKFRRSFLDDVAVHRELLATRAESCGEESTL